MDLTRDRERVEYGVVVVSGDPAGLSAAIRLKELAAERGHRITHRLGFVKGSNHETRTFYFLPEGWKTACKGYDPGAIAKELVACGILEPGSDGKTSKLVKLPGLGPRRCYVIRSDAFAESDET